MDKRLFEQELFLLAREVLERLRFQKKTLCVCESLTGGSLGAQITKVSGASHVFLGGIVAYNDDIKERIVGVDGAVLQQHSAVSSPCAKQMAQKTKALFGADYCLSLTGYAETFVDEKGIEHAPLAFIALAGQGGTLVRSLSFELPRSSAQLLCCQNALLLLLEELKTPAAAR